MEIKSVLVTGSEGYIGSALVPRLLANGYQVEGIDMCYYDDSYEQKSSSYVLKKKDIRDITENDISSYDAIIHLAALSNDPIGELDQSLTKEINEDASLNLAACAKKVGVKRFIFASSCSVYGTADSDVVNENSPVNPLTAYARSKRHVEIGLQKLGDQSFTVGIMRNSTVYGYASKYRNDLVVNNLVSTAVATGEIQIMSDGSPWRPLIDVRDLADCVISFLEAPTSLMNGILYNIGFSENNYQVRDIASVIQNFLPDCTISYSKMQENDRRSYKVDFTRFHKAFPQIKLNWPLAKSIQDLITVLKKNEFNQSDLSEKKFSRITELINKIKNGSLTNTLTYPYL